MEKGRLANLILIAKRVYHFRDTFIGSRLRDQPDDIAVFVFDFAEFDSLVAQRFVGCVNVGLSLALFRRVQFHGFKNQCLQRCLIYSVAFVEVNSTNCVAFQTRVEELFWIIH